MALCRAVNRAAKISSAFLLESGADLNCECDCGRLVAVAVLGNKPRLIPSLVHGGLDPDEFNADGFTPLMLAAGNDIPDAIPILIGCGAALELRDWEWTHGLFTCRRRE